MIGNSRVKNKIELNQPGFTLVEILVSVSLFAIIIVSITGIFKLAVDGQRSAIATQNIQESLKYFLEVTAKEIRMAQKNDGSCSNVSTGDVFKITNRGAFSDDLDFKNAAGECVTYSLAYSGTNKRFQIARQAGGVTQTDFISPAKIKMNDLHFFLKGTSSTDQIMVTINLSANALDSAQFRSDMTLQTSITSRYYK